MPVIQIQVEATDEQIAGHVKSQLLNDKSSPLIRNLIFQLAEALARSPHVKLEYPHHDPFRGVTRMRASIVVGEEHHITQHRFPDDTHPYIR